MSDKIMTLEGDVITQDVPEIDKPRSISPFDFVNAINYTKEDLMVDDWSEKQYKAFLVNKSLSFGADTIMYANEMNRYPHISNRLQFSFLINTIRPRKRFNKWLKAEKIEDLDLVKQYYNCSTKKAIEALSILTPEQLNIIRKKLSTGGLNNGK